MIIIVDNGTVITAVSEGQRLASLQVVFPILSCSFKNYKELIEELIFGLILKRVADVLKRTKSVTPQPAL